MDLKKDDLCTKADSRYIPSEQRVYHWVAGNDPNVDNYAYENFYYSYPNMIYRFIKIERLDGVRLFVPLVRKNITGKASQMQNFLLSPYPTILDEGAKAEPLPYPPPMELSEPSIQSSYPVP